MEKLTTVLWFDQGQARAAAEFYAATFPDSHVGTAADAPSDNPEHQGGGRDHGRLHRAWAAPSRA